MSRYSVHPSLKIKSRRNGRRRGRTAWKLAPHFLDALKRHPKVFDDLYVNMIHAGEVGGLLDTILTRLVKHIEKGMKTEGPDQVGDGLSDGDRWWRSSLSA